MPHDTIAMIAELGPRMPAVALGPSTMSLYVNGTITSNPALGVGPLQMTSSSF